MNATTYSMPDVCEQCDYTHFLYCGWGKECGNCGHRPLDEDCPCGCADEDDR